MPFQIGTIIYYNLTSNRKLIFRIDSSVLRFDVFKVSILIIGILPFTTALSVCGYIENVNQVHSLVTPEAALPVRMLGIAGGRHGMA